jgi:transcriptional regulator with XRE-family HTH domain
VTASPDVNRARFARFVARALTGARDRGMTDKDIHAATGVPPSTFHRWQRGQFVTAPDLDKVKRFCEGLGVNLAGAMTALGMAPGRDTPEPEAPLPPEVRIILRRLADPSVRESDKLVIREMLKMLAQQARRGEERREGTG